MNANNKLDGKNLNNQKVSPREAGVVHLLIPLLLLLIIGAVVYFLFTTGIIKNPLGKLPIIGQKGPKVSIKKEYKNPFNKSTQYVNPFQTYKNPFVVSK